MPSVLKYQKQAMELKNSKKQLAYKDNGGSVWPAVFSMVGLIYLFLLISLAWINSKYKTAPKVPVDQLWPK